MKNELRIIIILATFVMAITSMMFYRINNINQDKEIAEETIEVKEDEIKEIIECAECKKEVEEEKKTKEVKEVKKVKKKEIKFANCDVPNNSTFKSYMDYRCITSTGSNQYKLQKSIAYTGDYGLRMVDNRYCVALGSYYTTTIGQYVDIELENGNVIKGVLADCKANKHTDSTNRIHPDGSVVEFVVDTKSLDSTVRKMGDVSYVNGWNSKVVNIKVYDKVANY